MTRNISLPEEPFHTHIVQFPVELLPIALGALESRANTYTFAPDSVYNGIQLIRRAQVMLLLGSDVERAVQQVYRLLDTNLTGKEYLAEETPDGVTITPAIADVPDVPLASINLRLKRIEYLLDNFFNGTTYMPDIVNNESVRDMLRELITATQATDDMDADMLARLTQIAVLLG